MEGLFDAESARNSLIQRQQLAPNVIKLNPALRGVLTRYENAEQTRLQILALQQQQSKIKLKSPLEEKQRKRLKRRLKQKGGKIGRDSRGKDTVVSDEKPVEDPEIAREKLRIAEEKIKSDERIAQRLALEQQADRFQRQIEAQDLIDFRDRERRTLREIEDQRHQLEGQQAQLGFMAEGGRQNIERDRIQAEVGRYNADVERAHIERDRAIAVADRELAQVQARADAEVERDRILRQRESQEREILRAEREAELDNQYRLRGLESETERERLRRTEAESQLLHEERLEEIRNRRAQDAERAAIDRDREATLESTIRSLQRRDIPDPIPETQGFTQAQQRFMEQVFQRAGAEVDRRIGESETRIREQLQTFGSQTGQPINIEFLPQQAVEDEERDRAGGGSVNLSVASNQSGSRESEIGAGDLGAQQGHGHLSGEEPSQFHTPGSFGSQSFSNSPESVLDLGIPEERLRRGGGRGAYTYSSEETRTSLSPTTPSTEQPEEEEQPALEPLLQEVEVEPEPAALVPAADLPDVPEEEQSPQERVAELLSPRREAQRTDEELQALLAGDVESPVLSRQQVQRIRNILQADPVQRPDVAGTLQELEQGLAEVDEEGNIVDPEDQPTPRGLAAIPEGIVAAGQAVVEGVQEAFRPENPAEALARVEREAERRARRPEVRPGEQFGGQLRGADGRLIVGAQFGIGEDPEIEGFQAVGADAHGGGGGAEQPLAAPQGLETPAGVEAAGAGQVEELEEESPPSSTGAGDPRIRQSTRLFNSSEFNLHLSELTTRGRGTGGRGIYEFRNNTGGILKKIPVGQSATVVGAKADGTYKLRLGGENPREILIKDNVVERLVKEGKIIVQRK